jgi:hypothetical protein
MTLFDDLLIETDHINEKQRFDQQTNHLPGTMDTALSYYQSLLERHHQAMLAGNSVSTMALREDAYLLARKLNNGEPGILANEAAPGCILASMTKAQDGELPLWGQQARFEVEAAGVLIHIEMDGIFGIGASTGFWLGFSAHSVCKQSPFISETGYRSFLGVFADIQPNITPDMFAHRVIQNYIKQELRGSLVPQTSGWTKGEAA